MLRRASNFKWRMASCSSTKQFLTIMNGFDVKSRISLDEMENWSSIRKSKGKKRKKRWEKLRERRVLGIESLNNGGLVSQEIQQIWLMVALIHQSLTVLQYLQGCPQKHSTRIYAQR